MSLRSAFNYLLNLHCREVVIKRPGTAYASNIKISPSNFYRHLMGPEETVIDGREYIVTKDNLDVAPFPIPKRGDRIEDPELGILSIVEVREMFDFGGKLLGFRIRTG